MTASDSAAPSTRSSWPASFPLFTPPGTEAALVAGVARHVADGGHATAAGLTLVERFATWSRAPWSSGDAYSVCVRRR